MATSSTITRDLFYELDRFAAAAYPRSELHHMRPLAVHDINGPLKSYSRRSIQHHLCSLALHDITGPSVQWTEMTAKEVRDFVAGKCSELDDLKCVVS